MKDGEEEKVVRSESAEELASQEVSSLTVKVPGGIGDIAWIYAKLCRRHSPTRYIMSDDRPHRSLPFLQLLPEAVDCSYGDFLAGDVVGGGGGARTGIPEEGEFWVSANQHLESGARLEHWLPDNAEEQVDFHFYMDIPVADFKRADELLHGLHRPLILYTSSIPNEEISRWSPWAWYEFGAALMERWGMELVLLGAEYDRELIEKVEHIFNRCGAKGIRTIIAQPLGVALAVIQRAAYFAGFQSGLGVLATVLNTPSLMLLGSHLPWLRESWAPTHQLESGRFKGIAFQEQSQNRVRDNWKDALAKLDDLDLIPLLNEGLFEVCMVVCDKGALIKRNIERLLEFAPGNYTITIVDNASTDDAKDYLLSLSNAGKIRLLRVEQRLGIAAARNVGFKFMKSEFVFAIDDDVWVRTPDWFVGMIDVLKANPKTALVGPCGTTFPNFEGAGGWTPHGYENAPQFGDSTPTGPSGMLMDSIPGMCMGLRREAFFQTDFFDTQFDPFCAEDADMCLQLKDLGWDLRLAPAYVDHVMGGQCSHFVAEELAGKPVEDVAEESMVKFFKKWEGRTDLLDGYKISPVEHDLAQFYPSIDPRLVERHKKATKLGIRIWQHPLEFNRLCQNLPDKVSWVLEIGGAQGGWSYWLASVLSVPVNFCLIDPQTAHEGVLNDERLKIAVRELRREGHNAIYIKDFSSQCHQAVGEWLGDHRLDILHIDGGRAFEEAATDYLMYHTLVRPGGIILVHDVRAKDSTACRGKVYDLLSHFSETELYWDEGVNNGIGLIRVEE